MADNSDISDLFDGLVKVELEIPEALRGKISINLHRIYVDETDNSVTNVELIPCTVSEDGTTLTAYLEHLSVYGISESAAGKSELCNHKFVNGVCTICGKESDEPFIPTTLSVPFITADGKLRVFGNAPAETDVDIFIGEEKAVSVKSNKVGSYSAELTIASPTEGVSYNIKAVTVSPSGAVGEASEKVVYSPKTPVVTEFVMSCNGREYDLLSGEKYNAVLSGDCPVSFNILFSDNESVENVFVTGSNSGEAIEAVWDSEKNVFVVEGKYFNPENHSYMPDMLNITYSVKSGMSDIKALADYKAVNWFTAASGYVYEAVTSNPVSGVTVTIVDSTGVMWDASEYDLQNPVLTDNNGFYALGDVLTEGEWRIKLDCGSYETSYSKLTSTAAAIVSAKSPEAESYEFSDTGVTITFDKYIDPATIENVVIKDKSGNALTYTVDYSREEASEDGTVYARTFTFNCEALAASVEIPETVLSYSGAKAAVNTIRNEAADFVFADVNGDGKIKLNDVTLLRKYIVSGGKIS